MTTKAQSFVLSLLGLEASHEDAVDLLTSALNAGLIRREEDQLKALEAIEEVLVPEPEPVAIEEPEPVEVVEPTAEHLHVALIREIEGLYAQTFGFASLKKHADDSPDALLSAVLISGKKALEDKAATLLEQLHPVDPMEAERAKADAIVANASISFSGFEDGLEAEKMEALHIAETALVSLNGFVPGALLAQAEEIAALEAEKEVEVMEEHDAEVQNRHDLQAAAARLKEASLAAHVNDAFAVIVTGQIDQYLAAFTNEVLRQVCWEAKLPVSGKKAVLIERLREHRVEIVAQLLREAHGEEDPATGEVILSTPDEQEADEARKSALPELRDEVVEQAIVHMTCSVCGCVHVVSEAISFCDQCGHAVPDVAYRKAVRILLRKNRGNQQGDAEWLALLIAEAGGQVIEARQEKDQVSLSFAGVVAKITNVVRGKTLHHTQISRVGTGWLAVGAEIEFAPAG